MEFLVMLGIAGALGAAGYGVWSVLEWVLTPRDDDAPETSANSASYNDPGKGPMTEETRKSLEVFHGYNEE